MRHIVEKLTANYSNSIIGEKLADEISAKASNPRLVERHFDLLGHDGMIAITYFSYDGKKYAFWGGSMGFQGLYEIVSYSANQIELEEIWLTMNPEVRKANYRVFLDVFFNPMIKSNANSSY